MTSMSGWLDNFALTQGCFVQVNDRVLLQPTKQFNDRDCAFLTRLRLILTVFLCKKGRAIQVSLKFSRTRNEFKVT